MLSGLGVLSVRINMLRRDWLLLRPCLGSVTRREWEAEGIPSLAELNATEGTPNAFFV